MHLLIPFAAALPEAGRRAGAALLLPNLQAVLARWEEVERDDGDEWSLSPPHERAHAQALGLRGGAGLLPWAALQARADGIATGDLAWGLLTPAHWHLGTEQLSLIDPADLSLDDADSRELFAAVRELFTSEGWELHYGAPLRWYAADDSLATLATASLDRVIGRNVDPWLGSDPAARRIRRLQSEVQMLLHEHPLNERRQAQGLPAVNSFWLSGCGVAQEPKVADLDIDARLRGPALADDWVAWARAWQALDGGPLAELRAAMPRTGAARLTLCGERSWAAFEPAPAGVLKRLRRLWSPGSVAPLLESL